MSDRAAPTPFPIRSAPFTSIAFGLLNLRFTFPPSAASRELPKLREEMEKVLEGLASSQGA